MAMGFVFGAFGHTGAFVRMNSHLHVNPEPVPANCRCELIRTGEFRFSTSLLLPPFAQKMLFPITGLLSSFNMPIQDLHMPYFQQ